MAIIVMTVRAALETIHKTTGEECLTNPINESPRKKYLVCTGAKSTVVCCLRAESWIKTKTDFFTLGLSGQLQYVHPV